MALDALVNFFSTLAAYVFGTAISAIVLGYMLDHFVIKKIVQNKDVQDLLKLFHELKEHANLIEKKLILEEEKVDKKFK